MAMNEVLSLDYLSNPQLINLENAKRVRQQTKFTNSEIKDTFSKSELNKAGEKVSFKEGVKLTGKGFINKVKDTGKAIIEHPGMAIGIVAGTTLALAALPIIGISAMTGAAVLAAGFALYAAYNTGKDVVQTYRANEEGRYNDVRKGLEKIGGDGVDIALSMPFAPKAVNQISRFSKYGTSTIGLNKNLVSGIKSVKDIPFAFEKAETAIKYEMIGKEMGLKVKPKLVFQELNAKGGAGIFGAYEPTTGVLQVNSKMMTPKGKLVGKFAGIGDDEIILRHELEHFRQFSDIARTENMGVGKLSNTITDYYNRLLKKVDINDVEELGLSRTNVENMTVGDRSVLNKKLYQDVTDMKGTIKTGTKEAEMSKQYANGLIEKTNPKPEDVAEFQNTLKDINPLFMTPFDKMKIAKAQMKLYKSNILEKEAYEVQETYQKANITRRPGYKIVNAQILSAVENRAKEKKSIA